MSEEISRERIPYQEFRSIADLLRAHIGVHAGKLRAMIAFGDLLTTGNSFDIDLLEIVDDWQAEKLAVFSGSETFPLRGKLRLYFLTPQQFAAPAGITDDDQRNWTYSVLDRIRAGYETIYEAPSLDVHGILATIRPRTGYVELADSLQLTPRR